MIDYETCAATVDAVIARVGTQPGSLLPILHGVNDALGHVPQEAVRVIAATLNLTRAEVHGVVTFYHDFRETPVGRHLLRICRAESCQAVGANDLIAHATRRLGMEFGSTTADGALTMEPTYCLGLCAVSPALALDGEVYGHVTPDRFDEIVSEAMVTR